MAAIKCNQDIILVSILLCRKQGGAKTNSWSSKQSNSGAKHVCHFELGSLSPTTQTTTALNMLHKHIMLQTNKPELKNRMKDDKNND